MNRTNQKPKSPVRELIALTLIPKLGASRIRLLLEAVDHPQEIFRLGKRALESIKGIGPVLAKTIRTFNNWEEVDRIIEKTGKTGARIITCLDAWYPRLLKEIHDPPPVIWVMGDPSILGDDGIAVVGTRRATEYGIRQVGYFAGRLTRRGLAVISGLALGVDAAAHRATIQAGGKTIAVLGSGIDVIYPRNHRRLAKRIVDSGGAVITEYQPGTGPHAGNFPVRNRIVSGMTLGTLVIESGLRGGSMITARSALDQNREVFTVPHSLDNQNGMGCNAIIKRGWGKLVQDMEDILVEIPFEQKEGRMENEPLQARWKSLKLDDLAVSICTQMEEAYSVHIDDLSDQLHLAPHELLPTLLKLEIQNCVRQRAGKRFELL